MSTFRSYIRLGMASKWRNRGGLGEEQSSFDQIFNKLGLGRDMNKGGMILKNHCARILIWREFSRPTN